MRYSQEFLNEIKDKVPVSTVAGRRVALRRAGRELKGLSPFNQEKTPSFYVNDAKQFYHCFSSGKHGDVFKFLMETEGVSFPEAVERLAAEAGLSLPEVPVAVQAGMDRREGLLQVMEEAASFYRALLEGPDGEEGRLYLEGRGIDARAREDFRMGFAPQDRFALQRHLAGRGVDLAAMAELGLVSRDGAGTPRDRFRRRVLCPILDQRGRPVGFGGRSLDPESPAKYLNSPETPLFRKGAMLFNHHAARPAAEASGRVLAVEGYLDVVSLARAGIGHVVSPLGTSVTTDQAELLWGLSDEPVVALDGDPAGTRAARRLARASLPHLKDGRGLRFALLPDGLDPDDLVRRHGPDAMRAAEDRSVPALDVLWSEEAERHPLNSPERLARMEARMGALVATMPDGPQRRRCAREVLARLDALSVRPGPSLRRRPPELAPAAVPPSAAAAGAGPGTGSAQPGPDGRLRTAEQAYAKAPSAAGLARLRALQGEVAGERAEAPAAAEGCPPTANPRV